MTKAEQLKVNDIVADAMNRFLSDKETTIGVSPIVADALHWHQLRSCSADVAQMGNWYVLRSYSTIVALIDTETDTCYDFLRLVYGYTATSTQHISKFRHDYGRKCDPITGECQWGCAHEFMWKAV